MTFKVQECSFKLDKPHFSVSKTGREVNPHARCKQKNFQKTSKNQIWLKSQDCFLSLKTTRINLTESLFNWLPCIVWSSLWIMIADRWQRIAGENP